MSILARLFPHPVLSLSLAVVWVLLVNTVTVNAVVFGVIVGIVIPLTTRAYWPETPRLRNPVAMAGYVLLVLWDIVVANVQVARIILFMPASKMRPGWVTIPVDLRSPEAITVLAGTITMTPGTVSSDIAADGRSILVHCLHAPDPAAVRDEIKSRYERRLKEIFE